MNRIFTLALLALLTLGVGSLMVIAGLAALEVAEERGRR